MEIFKQRLDFLHDGARAVDVGLLMQVAERRVGVEVDRALFMRQLAREHAKKRGLAGPVRSDDAHFVAFLHVEGDVLEDDVRAVFFFQVFATEYDHI